MRALCLTITEETEAGRHHTGQLLAGLGHQGVAVDLVLVVRGGHPPGPWRPPEGVRLSVLPAPRVIGLSAARNLALAHAREAGLLGLADLVAFPDDDCVYPPGLLGRVADELVRTGGDRGCGCVVGAYGPAADAIDRRRFPLGDEVLAPGRIMRSGSSGAMFFSAATVSAIGGFDERLGLGGRFGASEDADYLLRATRHAGGLYRPAGIVVQHPYKAHRVSQYYVGNIAVLAKHARSDRAVRMLLGRRLLGGVLLVARRRLRAGDLRRAAAAIRAIGPLDRSAVPPLPPSAPEPPFAPAIATVIDGAQPLRDRQISPAGDGATYARALALVRQHEEPVAFAEVALDDGWLRAADAAAVLRGAGISLEPAVPGAATHAAGTGVVRSPDAELPAAAVIVPTAGRPDDLVRCLDSLRALDYPRLEIIVVDNRPGEAGTLAVVSHAAARDPRVRYVAEARPGSSVARNRGIAETTAQIVAFTDDDVAVDPLWLRWMVEPFVLDPEVEVVTGLVLPRCFQTPAQERFELQTGFGKGLVRRTFDIGPNRSPRTLLFPYWGAPFGSGNSMAFRRTALAAIDGFDPALGAGSPSRAGADIESFTQLLVRGGRLVYEPRAVVWHDHRRDEGGLERQMYAYAVGATAIMTKWVLRDPRLLLAFGRTLAASLATARHAWPAATRRREAAPGGSGQPPRARAARSIRGLSGFAAGPVLYARSCRWARRLELRAVVREEHGGG